MSQAISDTRARLDSQKWLSSGAKDMSHGLASRNITTQHKIPKTGNLFLFFFTLFEETDILVWNRLRASYY